MTRTLVVAALLLTAAGFLLYASQDDGVETPSPDKAVDLELPASGNHDIASDVIRSQETVGADQAGPVADAPDEDAPVHIGEFIDPDDLRTLQGGEPLHIGEFLDPDAPIYSTEDEAIHIGKDLSAYDPTEYIAEDDIEPLHIGPDLSAYGPLDIIGGAVDSEDKHIGEPIHEPL